MKKSKPIPTPHDKVFRAMMGFQEVSSLFVQRYLPDRYVKELDPKSLTLLQETHLDKALQKTLFQSVPLVDVNQIPDEELEKQEWVGALAMAMKYIRAKEMTPYALEALKILPAVNNARTREILYHLLVYLFNTGNICDTEGFIEASHELPDPMRSEIMSLAKELEARGEAKGKAEGIAKGRVKAAINMLKEGADPAFVARVSTLSVEEVKRLQASISKNM